MSERMTEVSIPGLPEGTGFAAYGRKTHAEMIAALRAHAKHDKEVAEKILAAADEDFVVETYTGVYVQRNRERIYPEDLTHARLP